MQERIVLRKVISLTMAFSFMVMSFSGILLYFTPKGKVANWSNWELLGLTKEQFSDIHMTTMVLFLVVAVWHIYNNFGALVSYTRNSSRKITLFKKELLIAMTLTTLFVSGALVGFQPFKSILDLNEAVKDYWEEKYTAPPYGQAETSSLASFCNFIGIDEKVALERLTQRGITVATSSQTLEKIAKDNHISAKVIYESLRPTHRPNKTKISYIGRKTLKELANMKEINLENSLTYLKSKGFNASPHTQMKHAADYFGITPRVLLEQLSVL